MLETTILELLDRTGGNVQETARHVSVSESYVHRIKSEKWTDPFKALAVVPPAPDADSLTSRHARHDPDDLLSALIPPNTAGVSNLRDAAIADLTKQFQLETISAKQTIALLAVLLRYEAQLRNALKPSLALFQDNRQTVVLTELASQFAGMSPDQLAALGGGVRTTEVVEVTPIELES